jgi:hypothetical protein
MIIVITCNAHGADVKPAGDALHWLELPAQPMLDQHERETQPHVAYSLDGADLYCTATQEALDAVAEHDFVVSVHDDEGYWLAFAGTDEPTRRADA